LVIVVGSQNSSNSRRLREVAVSRGVESHLVDSADEVQSRWLSGKVNVGVTAGASAPEILVKNVIECIRAMSGADVVQMSGVDENVSFALPRELNATE